MYIDGFQLFTGTSNGQSGGITASAYADAPTTGTQNSSNVIDYGIINGLPASTAGGGGARDMGIGDSPALKISATVVTTFAGGTSLQLQLQGAPDAGNNTPGTYTTLWTGPAVAEAQLIQGAQIANVDFPREIPGVGPVRYVRLVFVTVGTHTAGAVEAFVALDEFEQIKGTGGALSGYPAGIAVAN